MRKVWKDRRAEGYIDVCVLVLCALLVIAFAVKALPVFVAKQQLDNFVTELAREAEIAGEIGSATSARERQLIADLGIRPTISWSKRGKVQLHEEFTIMATLRVDMGSFGEFRAFPITLRADASGKSEVYWK